MNWREYLTIAQNLCVNLGGDFHLYIENIQGYMDIFNKVNKGPTYKSTRKNNWSGLKFAL